MQLIFFDTIIKLSIDIIEFTSCSVDSWLFATIKIRNLSVINPTFWNFKTDNKTYVVYYN